VTGVSPAAGRRRWPRQLGIAILVGAGLLGAVVAALPWLVDTAAARRALEREISTRAGGTVRYDSLALRLFPLPRAQVRGLTVHVPDRLTGRAALLQIKLSLAALLTGAVRLTAVELEQPVLEIRLGGPAESASDPVSVYRESVGPIVEWLVRAMPGMAATIVDGHLDVLQDGQRVVALSKLAVQAHVAADAVDAQAHAAADQWRAAEGHVRIASGSLAAVAQLQVKGLRVPELRGSIETGIRLAARPGPVDATFEVETDGRGAGRATIMAAAPQLVLERGARQLELGPVRLAADAARDPGALTVSLRHLALGDLLPGATGALRAKADGSDPALELQASAIDLARVRAALLAVADDVAAVRDTAAIVRSGILRSLKIAGSGTSLATLATGIRPTAIDVERPVLELRLGRPGAGSTASLSYRKAVGPVVDELARALPGMSATIVDGRLDVRRDGRAVVALSKLAVQATVAPDAIEMRASAAADRWRAAQGHIRIAPGALAGSGHLQVTGLEAAGLLAALGADAPITARPGPIDARLEARTDGQGTERATITAASPQLVLERGTRRLGLGAVRLAADVARDPSTLTVSLRQLELGDLLAGATGALRTPTAGGPLTVELLVPSVDLTRVRAGALALGGDVADVRDTADVVRGGTLRGLRIRSTGRTLEAVVDATAIRADATLEAGEIALPDVGLAARDGRGPLTLTGGVVRGSQLSWRIGASSFRDGALALPLLPEVSLASLRASVDANLGEALTIARKALDAATVAALADVEALAGRATGSFAFEKGGQPEYQLDLTSLAATGRYRGLPFPLALSAGEVHYTPEALRVRGLSGAVGRSRLNGISAELALAAPGSVRAASGEVVLEMDELYPWLASLDRLRPALKEVKSVAGAATVRVTRLSGSLDDADFAATIQPREVRAVLTPLPAPLALTGGSVQVTPAALQLDQVAATLLDARITASGKVEDYATPARRLDVTLAAGAAGAEAFEWLRTRWGVEPRALPRPPVTLDAARVRWTAAKSAEHFVQGTFGLAGGARTEIDLAWGPASVHVRRLTLKDADSDALVALRWGPKRASFAYAGRIDERSIARVMARPPEALTRLQGNFRAEIDLVEPRRSTAAGMLAVEGFELLEHWGWPVSIERLRLDAGGNALTIRNTVVKMAGQRVMVGGSAAARPATFAVDLRAEADRIDVRRLLDALPRDVPDDGDGPAGFSIWDVPAEGRVTVAAKSLTLGERVVESIAGAARLEPNRAVVELTQATVCGVSAAPLSVTLTPAVATVRGRVMARGAPLDTVLSCIVPGRDLVMTGRLDVDGEYAASGPLKELVDRLNGSLRARSRNGRIEYGRLWPKLVEIDSVAEQMEPEDTAELVARGLAYREAAVVVTLDPGRARIDRFTLDSRALGVGMTGSIDLDAGELALRGVVAPFGSATASLRRIPLLGRLFGARIIGVPFSVSGDWHDPRVRPLGPEAIAGSMLDLLGRFLNAPIQLLNPLLPRRDRLP
jgi:hypothetical protein